jgi:hypothetical protein
MAMPPSHHQHPYQYPHQRHHAHVADGGGRETPRPAEVQSGLHDGYDERYPGNYAGSFAGSYWDQHSDAPASVGTGRDLNDMSRE